MVKASGLSKSPFQSMGVANMKDAPAKPNWIIAASFAKDRKIRNHHPDRP